ncbi:MAG: hypothetical protein A3E78_02855 [Alphaproteobacteria bacterium RIFCSPHIGHO2_12_FULL_63_12]|nr:MAG: hypothetical protein A3E78_02855 [Alphaproteobacteria bacterium RIFCSPHIGHO2_12_FULL_63_12]
MKFIAAIVIIALSVPAASARPYDEIMEDARAAFEADDFKTAAERLDEAQIARPYSLFLTRNRVLARILDGRMGEAIALAREIADRGLILETPPNEAFDRMRAEPAYATVDAQMSENAKPKGAAQIYADYVQPDLLPEAISSAGKKMLIGSVRTGEIFSAGATLAPLARLNGGVFDIEQRTSIVFVAVNSQLAFERRGDAPPFAMVAELDPQTGSEIARHAPGPGPSLIGDIEVAKDGRIFASDSLTPRIIIFDHAGPTKISRMAGRELTDPRFVNLQGLALDEKRGRLFVADYLAGLFVIDIATGKVEPIANPTRAHLGGVDGLYYYDGDLIGVQNGTAPQRIIRIDLDRRGTTAKSLSVLQQALPEWREPTHGAVIGKDFVYIATSNWPAYDDDGNLRDGAGLEPLRLMSVDLD